MRKPKKQGLTVLIPSSVVADSQGLRSATMKIGAIARALAIYRADEVFIYRDPEKDQTDLLEKILKFADCPPYLRKKMFGKDRELRYTGEIPPLQTPKHCVEAKVEKNSIREGVVVDSQDKGGKASMIDVGLPEPAVLYGRKIRKGTTVTVKVVSEKKPLEVVQAKAEEIPENWGYNVRKGSPSEAEELYRNRKGLKLVGTSKKGTEFRKASMEKRLALVFGPPFKGVQGYPFNFDEIINFIPRQGTLTVRTEEAIHATLAVVNSCI